MAHRAVYYFGVKINAWPGPRYHPIHTLGLKASDFNSQITAVALTLQKNGFEAYIVGGSIRDLLLKTRFKPKDFDIVTSALPQQVKPHSVHRTHLVLLMFIKMVFC